MIIDSICIVNPLDVTRRSAWILIAAAAAIGCDRAEPAPVAERATEAASASEAPAAAPSFAPAEKAVAPAPAAKPTTKASPAPAVIDPAVAEQLRIKRLVVATSIEDREPKGGAESFSLAELDRVYAFVEVDNPVKGASEVVVTFEPPAIDDVSFAPIGNVRLDVGASPRWRTWAYTRGVKRAGEWTAVVSTPGGKELARQPFTVTDA